jgi:signal transduction histidine kinase
VNERVSLLRALERLLAIDAAELGEVLSGAADVVGDELRADKVDVFVHDPASDSLVALGTSHTPMSRRERAAGLDRLPVAHGGRAAAVFASGEPFLTRDASEDPLELRGLVERVGVRSTIMVPFELGPGGRGAVLAICAGQPDRFDADDLAFARAFSGWIALVARRAELTRELARTAREAGRREAAEELVMVVAHDLRNVLSPALGRVQLLKRRAEREERPRDTRDAGLAESAMLRVVRLVSDLLDVSRIDRGLFDLSLGAVDLVALLREVARSLGSAATPVTVQAEQEELVLAADAGRLRQVFENLVSNAVKHVARGAGVSIEVRGDPPADPEWAEVDVMNPGAPIPPELAPRVFDRFVRSGSSAGLGLGLHVAREIVLAHGGTIALVPLESGVRFRVRLPLR